ncbi:hypothetical protein [Actinoalloteichus caeruleus]|nr:hypothetical protein [Actinoalloteichus caeruleus]
MPRPLMTWSISSRQYWGLAFTLGRSVWRFTFDQARKKHVLTLS